MQKRKTIVPAIAGLDLPIDWRAAQRAHQETFVIHVAFVLLWTLLLQAKLTAAMHISGLWWLPLSFLPNMVKQPGWWANIPWPAIVVWFIGLPVMDAMVRTIRAFRSCDRTGLGVEYGSAYIGIPEYYAAADPKSNLFPPGYDLYGGFHPEERRKRLLDLEALTTQREQTAERMIRASVKEIPVASHALVGHDRQSLKPAPKSRIQEILDGAE